MSRLYRNITITAVAAYLFVLFSAFTSGQILAIDSSAAIFFEEISNPLLIFIARYLDIISNAYVLSAIGLMLTAIALWKKMFKIGTFFFLGLYGGFALTLFLKLLFSRPRPELADRLVEVFSYSYPSGHAMGATIFIFLFIFWLNNIYDTSRRVVLSIRALGILFILAVGISRVYVGVHFASDVIGGWLAGSAWVFLIFSIYEWLHKKRKIGS